MHGYPFPRGNFQFDPSSISRTMPRNQVIRHKSDLEVIRNHTMAYRQTRGSDVAPGFNQTVKGSGWGK